MQQLTTTPLVYVPVDANLRLPNKTDRYGIIVEGSDCIDSAFFTETTPEWFGLGAAPIAQWLEPQHDLILISKKDLEEIVGEAFRTGQVYESLCYRGFKNDATDKQQYISQLIK